MRKFVSKVKNQISAKVLEVQSLLCKKDGENFVDYGYQNPYGSGHRRTCSRRIICFVWGNRALFCHGVNTIGSATLKLS